MSKEPKDVIGNTIHEGDIVLVFLDKPQTIAKIAKIHNTGLTEPNGKTPFSLIECVSPINIAFSPTGGNIPNVVVVRNPDPEKVLADAVSRSASGPIVIPKS